MSDQHQTTNAIEERVRFWMPFLVLADVGLMFAGLFVANAAAWWIWLPFHITLAALTIFVLKLAFFAARCVPQSIPYQRQIGSFLYISCQCIMFFDVGQLPMILVAYLMFAGPLGMWFLFDHLLED